MGVTDSAYSRLRLPGKLIRSRRTHNVLLQTARPSVFPFLASCDGFSHRRRLSDRARRARVGSPRASRIDVSCVVPWGSHCFTCRCPSSAAYSHCSSHSRFSPGAGLERRNHIAPHIPRAVVLPRPVLHQVPAQSSQRPLVPREVVLHVGESTSHGPSRPAGAPVADGERLPHVLFRSEITIMTGKDPAPSTHCASRHESTGGSSARGDFEARLSS